MRRTTSLTAITMLLTGLAGIAAAGDMQSFTEPNSGLTISLPASWAVQGAQDADGPSIMLASSQAALAGPSGGAAAAMIFTGKTAEFGGLSDPASLAEMFASNMTSGGSVESQTEVSRLTVQGQPAALKKVTGTVIGQKAVVTFVSLIAGDDVAMLMGVDTSMGSHGEVFNKVAQSMTFAGGGAAPAAEPVADVSPEETEKLMKDFVASFNGDAKSIQASLGKHAAASIDDPDSIGAYSLEAPELLSSEAKDGHLCFKVKAKAGVTLRTFEVCWLGGKIRSVQQTEMGFVGR